jgi:hypothetical protein
MLALGAAGMTLASACGGNVTAGTGGSTSGSSTSSAGTTNGSSASSTSTGSSTSSSASTGASSGGNCNPSTCMPGFICCGGGCVNPQNDILNCGNCTIKCTGPHPYCDKGTCAALPPCSGTLCPSPEFCCGDKCCNPGELCCDVPGPVALPFPQCTTPVNGTCPGGCTACVCASPETPIATPRGDRPIADLAAGDLVYTVDHDAIVAVPVLRVNRTPVRDHHVVRVALASGAVLEVSPGHPTADGRTFGDLRAGGRLDGIGVTSAELVPYAHPFTYDILPAGETHTYFAGGARIGTTLAP